MYNSLFGKLYRFACRERQGNTAHNVFRRVIMADDQLSGDEIDALLQRVGGEAGEIDLSDDDARTGFTLHDFLQPAFLTPRQTHAITHGVQRAFQRMCNEFATQTDCELSWELTSLDQLTFEQYQRCVPAFYSLALVRFGSHSDGWIFIETGPYMSKALTALYLTTGIDQRRDTEPSELHAQVFAAIVEMGMRLTAPDCRVDRLSDCDALPVHSLEPLMIACLQLTIDKTPPPPGAHINICIPRRACIHLFPAAFAAYTQPVRIEPALDAPPSLDPDIWMYRTRRFRLPGVTARALQTCRRNGRMDCDPSLAGTFVYTVAGGD